MKYYITFTSLSSLELLANNSSRQLSVDIPEDTIYTFQHGFTLDSKEDPFVSYKGLLRAYRKRRRSP